MTAFVIPNAIQITTRTSKYTFASFLARDTAYDVIYNIWRLARPEEGFSEAESMGRSALDATHTPLGAVVPPNGLAEIANGTPAVVVPVHKVTHCACGREGKHYSELVIDAVLPGTPERIYNLMFASGFFKDFLRMNQKLEGKLSRTFVFIDATRTNGTLYTHRHPNVRLGADIRRSKLSCAQHVLRQTLDREHWPQVDEMRDPRRDGPQRP
jgi:hypothetical protein